MIAQLSVVLPLLALVHVASPPLTSTVMQPINEIWPEQHFDVTNMSLLCISMSTTIAVVVIVAFYFIGCHVRSEMRPQVCLFAVSRYVRMRNSMRLARSQYSFAFYSSIQTKTTTTT